MVGKFWRKIVSWKWENLCSLAILNDFLILTFHKKNFSFSLFLQEKIFFFTFLIFFIFRFDKKLMRLFMIFFSFLFFFGQWKIKFMHWNFISTVTRLLFMASRYHGQENKINCHKMFNYPFLIFHPLEYKLERENKIRGKFRTLAWDALRAKRIHLFTQWVHKHYWNILTESTRFFSSLFQFILPLPSSSSEKLFFLCCTHTHKQCYCQLAYNRVRF